MLRDETDKFKIRNSTQYILRISILVLESCLECSCFRLRFPARRRRAAVACTMQLQMHRERSSCRGFRGHLGFNRPAHCASGEAQSTVRGGSQTSDRVLRGPPQAPPEAKARRRREIFVVFFGYNAVLAVSGHVRTCPDMSGHVQTHGCNPVRAPPRSLHVTRDNRGTVPRHRVMHLSRSTR